MSRFVLNEDLLQELLFEHPECIPISDIEPGFSTLVSVCREMPTPHGPIDNLFMTMDGDIVLVEAKLFRNPEARRKVVAQALDYASCLFEMGYEQFQAAALKGDGGKRSKATSLYELFRSDPEALDESRFIDAVSRNLRRGRIVILVVGDGIREEAERLTEALQSHAGFHFTFALVELALFELPDGLGRVIVPSTLAKTTMIPRGIVELDDQHRMRVRPPTEQVARSLELQVATGTITAEDFFAAIAASGKDVPDRIRAFLKEVDEDGVKPDIRRAMSLKWEAPSGQTFNLGSLHRDGTVWVEATHPLPTEYVQALANAWGGNVSSKNGKSWIMVDGHLPRIEWAMDGRRAKVWVERIADFILATQRAAESEASSERSR